MKQPLSATEILEKIEIAFWTISIRFMGNRKVFKLVVGAIIILVLFFLIGMVLRTKLPVFNNQASLIISTNQETVDLPLISTPTVIPGQSNLIIILVDDLASKQPKLLGLWLAGSVASAPQIIFLPIFPSLNNEDSDTIARSFSVEADGSPDIKFLEFLQQKEIWWDHYLVADKNALADLVSLMGGFEWAGSDFTGPEFTDILLANQNKSQVALLMQAEIVNELCRTAPNWAEEADPDILWGLFKNRFRSDLLLGAVQQAQERISEPDGMPVCEFPTLKGISQSWSLD